MQQLANTVRFFGTFNFLTCRELFQHLRYVLSSTGLHLWALRGTCCAYGPIMVNKTENLNATNEGLRVIPTMDFKAEVLESKQPVLVEFWAPWSRPCQVFDSVLQEVAVACSEKIKVLKVDADDSLDLSLWYDIQSVPTLLCFVRGNPCWRIVGTASKEAILAKIKSVSQ